MENENVVVVEEYELPGGKKKLFKWAKFLAWVSIVIALTSPVLGAGVGILAMSMAEEENVDEVYTVSYIGIGIGTFFFIVDIALNIANLF